MQERFNDLEEIYNQLENNENWAGVNKRNLQGLITIAIEKGNKDLEQKLHDWS